ncbi:MAG: hypothetical protein HY931_00075 [Candidatus Falkowbacteria bacterium]|nr:MAG: hypothetical protein HY931_00075 [Candidatus Falkowbacteria bacterium]
MKNIWSILCTRSIIDQRTNALSLIDCVDELTITFSKLEEMSAATKNIPVILEVVSLWHDEAKEADRILDYVIEIADPQGKKIGEFKNQAKIEAGKTRLRAITGINGLQLTVEGRYVVKILLQEATELKPISEIPIDVRFLLNLKK